MRRKAFIITAGLISVLVGAIILFFVAVPPDAKKIPEVLESSLCGDGRFEFSCMIETNGESREYFWLTGEKNGELRHISGRVLGSPFNLYYANGYIYRYNTADDIWQRYLVEDLEQAVAMYAELEPNAAFKYDSLIDIEYIGHKMSNKRPCFNFAVTPEPSGWVGQFFTDVKYHICLSRWGELISAEVIAKLKEDKNTTMRAFAVLEKDGNIKIEPPSTKFNN